MLVEFVRDVFVVVAFLMSAIAIALHIGVDGDQGASAPTRDTRTLVSPAAINGAGMAARTSTATEGRSE